MLYIVFRVEVPPSLLHVVFVNRGVISVFLEATTLPFFPILLNALLYEYFPEMKNKIYRILKDERKNEIMQIACKGGKRSII